MQIFTCTKCGHFNILTPYYWNDKKLPCETRCEVCGELVETNRMRYRDGRVDECVNLYWRLILLRRKYGALKREWDKLERKAEYEQRDGDMAIHQQALDDQDKVGKEMVEVRKEIQRISDRLYELRCDEVLDTEVKRKIIQAARQDKTMKQRKKREKLDYYLFRE